MNQIIVEVHSSHGDRRPRYQSFEKKSIKIGRSFDCDIILQDQFVSKEHLTIEATENGQFKITDRSSKNGTLINKQYLKDDSQTIVSGQICQIGKTRLRIYSSAHPIEPARPFNTGTKIQTYFDKPVIALLMFIISLSSGLFYSWIANDTKTYMDARIYEDAFSLTAIIAGLAVLCAVLNIIIQRKSALARQLCVVSMIMFVSGFWITFINPYIYFHIPSMEIEHFVSAGLSIAAFLFIGSFVSYIDYGHLRKAYVFGALVIGLFIAGVIYTQEMGYKTYPDYPSTIILTDKKMKNSLSIDDYIREMDNVFVTYE